MKKDIALQLYTVRDEMQKDFVGTLEKVAEIGYKGVEFAGYGGLSASELKKHLDRLGLAAVGTHSAPKVLENNLEEEIKYNQEIGNNLLVYPWFRADSKEGYLKMAALCNEIGKKCKEKNMRFAYHNHAHELADFDGKTGLELLYENTDPGYMKLEIDTYWIHYGGLDPKEFVLKYAGRCPIVHIKDMKEGGGFAEVGTGVIDIKGIVKAADKAGCEWLVVEQDRCEIPSLESVEISFRNLKKILEEL